MLDDEAQVLVYNEIGLLKDEDKPDGPYFTGWKPVQVPPYGVVGQIVYWFPKTSAGSRYFAYVNLPGFQAGAKWEGSTVDVGEERLTEPIDLEAMRAMLVRGLARLKEIIAEQEANPWG